MKRMGNLYNKIFEYENLLYAVYRASKGKRHKKEAIEFLAEIEENVWLLQNSFRSEQVPLGDYHYFTIYDPKERRICAASFKERIIHHAIMNVISPYFEKKMIFHNYACRKEKGQHKALRHAKFFARGSDFYLQMDIRKYFDSIDHSILFSLLNRVFKDKQLLNLLDHVIKSYSTKSNKGLPIGNLTSQYFANLYLSELDHFVKEKLRCKSYLRYMDDFVLWGTQNQVKVWRREILDFLKCRLKLDSKRGGIINQCKKGMTFLGFRVFPCHLRISQARRKRSLKKLKQIEDEYMADSIDCIELQHRVGSLFAHLQFAKDVKSQWKVVRTSILYR